MCTASTAKRRRRQAANGYKHMSPLKRPHYSKIDAGKSARRLAERIATERRMSQKRK